MKRGTHFGGPLSFAQGGLSLPDGTELRTAMVRVQATGGVIGGLAIVASTPLTIAPAPGAGKAILVLAGTARYKHAGNETTAAGSFNIRTGPIGGSNPGYLTIAVSTLFNALTADKIATLDAGVAGELVANAPLLLSSAGVPAGNITVSDNAAYLEIVVLYVIVKVS